MQEIFKKSAFFSWEWTDSCKNYVWFFWNCFVSNRL